MKFLLTCFLVGFSFHPIHISVTDIVYDEKERELEITTRIFIDDFELAMRESRKDATLNVLALTHEEQDALLKEYLLKHLEIKLENKAQKISYLGHETESEAFECYAIVSNVKKWETIEVRNDILHALYDDQSNLVHVTVREKIRSLRLMKDEAVGKLVFKQK